MKKLARIILLPLFLLSCATFEKGSDSDVEVQRYWPPGPDLPRYEYLMRIYSSADILKKTDDDLLKEFVVGKPLPEYIFKRPVDVASGSGMLYVLDSETPLVHVFDFARRSYFKFGYRFEGELAKPVGITVDKKGRVYVADRGRNSIIIYDGFGLFQSLIDLNGITTQLAGIVTDPEGNIIYVVDRGGIDSEAHQIIVLKGNGELVKRIGSRGREAGQFNLPMDVALGSNNILYVLDTGNFRVQTFDGEGEPLSSWGSAGNGIGQFGMPRSITLDRDNNVYVSDAQFGNVQVFNSDGELLMPIGRLSQQDLPGQYSLITGVTFDKRDNLYVLDQYFKKIEIFKKLTDLEQSQILE